MPTSITPETPNLPAAIKTLRTLWDELTQFITTASQHIERHNYEAAISTCSDAKVHYQLKTAEAAKLFDSSNNPAGLDYGVLTVWQISVASLYEDIIKNEEWAQAVNKPLPPSPVTDIAASPTIPLLQFREHSPPPPPPIYVALNEGRQTPVISSLVRPIATSPNQGPPHSEILHTIDTGDTSAASLAATEDSQYADALKKVESYGTQNAKLAESLSELIATIKAFKEKGGKKSPPTSVLTKVLDATFNRVSGNEQMNQQTYDHLVTSMQGSRSKALRILGGIMLAIGVLVILAFPITAAAIALTGAAVAITATTTTAAAGGLLVGGGASLCGYRFFTKNGPTPLTTAMKKINDSIPPSIATPPLL